MELVITKGIYAMGVQTRDPFVFEVWKGLRPDIRLNVDNMNSNYIVNCTSFAAPGMVYTYETSDGRKVISKSPTFRGRFAEKPVPVKVKITVVTPQDGTFVKELDAVPHEKTTPAPLAARGYAFMTIYHHNDKPEKLAEYRKAMGRLFLENNIGERSGHIYQGQRAADMFKIPTDDLALDIAANRFTNEFVNGHARRDHKRHHFIFSTSGATVADYELAAGMDFMCAELYAAGAQNLAFATAEMRGAARNWRNHSAICHTAASMIIMPSCCR